MNNIEFVNAVKSVANNYKTLYVMGCFGAPMTAANKKRYTNNHSFNKKPARTNMIMTASADTFGFDCSGLIKGILWGWSGSKTATYGGAKYASNNVPDCGADKMISLCKEVSTDFSKIEVGEAVWAPGHIGVYVGDGLAVECTPSWDNKVQFTACNRDKSGYNRRNWTKHGKLPWIEYVKQTPTVTASVYYPAYTGNATSIDAVFSAIGVPAAFRGTYSKRKPVAEANGIANYTGEADQNTLLKKLAKQGKLKKVVMTASTATNATASTSAYYQAYKGTSTSLDTIFKAIGVPVKYCGNYTARKPVAKANGIANYAGTSEQNTKLKNLAKQGKLKKV